MKTSTLDNILKSYLTTLDCTTFEKFYKGVNLLSSHNICHVQDKYNTLQVYSRLNAQFSLSHLKEYYDPYIASFIYPNKC